MGSIVRKHAVNIATPGWLMVARDAAIRRASIDSTPLVSHYQLLYDQALSFSASEPRSTTTELRSSQLKEKLKVEEGLVKQLFLEDVFRNNELINTLGNGSPVTVLSQEVLNILSSSIQTYQSLNYGSSDVLDHRPRRRNNSLLKEPNKKADPSNIFSCVSCGIACYACCAILQQSQAAAGMSNEDVDMVDPQSCSDRKDYSRKQIF